MKEVSHWEYGYFLVSEENLAGFWHHEKVKLVRQTLV